MNNEPETSSVRRRLVEQEIDVSLFGILSAVLRNAKIILWCAGVTAVLAPVVTLLRMNYVAESRFMPQEPANATGRLAGFAAQFGLSLANVSAGESVSFYAELVRSRELLTQVALTRYECSKGRLRGDTVAGTLIDLYGIEGDTPEQQRLKAVEFLERKVTVVTDLKSSLITVAVKARCPELAEQVNRRILDLVNDFNLKKRQSQASAERQFVEARLDQAGQELAAAEGDLRRFFEQNRRYQDAPQLTFEATRLQRTVDLRQQVYTTLAQAFEQARIEEVRNTPVITIVDQPEGSAHRARSVVGAVITGLILGGLFGAAVAFGRNYVARERANNPARYTEFRQLREAARVRFRGSAQKGSAGGAGVD